MPQSLANILVHLVFSTKDRTRWIENDWRDELHAYIGGVVRRCGGDLLAAGSVEDHIHLLFPLPRTIAVAELVKEIKSGSTRWVHDSHRVLVTFIGRRDTASFPSVPVTRNP